VHCSEYVVPSSRNTAGIPPEPKSLNTTVSEIRCTRLVMNSRFVDRASCRRWIVSAIPPDRGPWPPRT
jgi:hypothetical protein